ARLEAVLQDLLRRGLWQDEQGQDEDECQGDGGAVAQRTHSLRPPCLRADWHPTVAVARRDSRAGGGCQEGLHGRFPVAHRRRCTHLRTMENRVMSLQAVLAGLHANPSDELGWLAIADCLEEQGEMDRAELARLSAQVRSMKTGARRKRMEDRIID